MKLYSENIKRYIINNIKKDASQEVSISDLSDVKELTINKLNYRMEEAVFIPEELSYLKNIEKINFVGFEITDRIIESLNRLKSIKKIGFDHCKYNGNRDITIPTKEIYINYSNKNLLIACKNKRTIEKMTLKDMDVIDIGQLQEYIGLKELVILNCNITNLNKLTEFRSIDAVQIIGGNVDDCSIIDRLKETINISYNSSKFYNVG